MEIALLCALVLINGVWLFFFHKIMEQVKRERGELMNRVSSPSPLIIPQDTEPSPPYRERDYFEERELAGIGEVNPALYRKEKDEEE